LVIYPLLIDGFPVTDDGTWLIIRFTAFFETLRTGQFPVRFIYRLNNGMGYPVSNFLYPLYLYLATPIHIAGFNFVNSIKILLIFNIFLSVFFSYFWLRTRFDSISSFLGSAALVLSPYYLFDLYKRGSIGELLIFSIVPFILWQIEKNNFVLLSIGFSLLILAHNSLAVLFILLVICYAILIKSNIKLLIGSLILGFGLSSFFWIPAILDLSGTIFMNTKVSNFYDYLLIPKNYYLIGLSSILIITAGIAVAAYNKKLFRDRLFIFLMALSIIIVFLNFPQSKFFWKLFPFRDFIQFPFRLLSVLSITLVYLAAFTSNNLKNKKYVYSAILLTVFIFQTIIFLHTVEIQKHEEGFYSTNQSTTTVSNEYLNRWFIKPENNEKVFVVSGQGKVNTTNIRPGKINLSTNFETDGEIQVNYSYFPKWKVFVNGKEKEINYWKSGLINFQVDKGIYDINIRYEQSRLHKISNLISAVSIIVLIYFLIKIINIKFLSYTLKEK
jgi:hypothetical protein